MVAAKQDIPVVVFPVAFAVITLQATGHQGLGTNTKSTD